MVTTIRDAIADTAGSSLVGLSLYGSLATGDFEPDVSDIDLIAVLTDVPDERLVSRLREMHSAVARANPEWDDRIEVDYVSARGLADCRTDPTTIARISPGEPLHIVEAGRDFLLDWYPARQVGLAVLGPPLGSLIPPIPDEEYLAEVRRYLAGFAHRFDDDASQGSQAYAILTMCRGLATLRTGDRPSKREAAENAKREFPRWSDLIDRAIAGVTISGTTISRTLPERSPRLEPSSRRWLRCSSCPESIGATERRLPERVPRVLGG